MNLQFGVSDAEQAGALLSGGRQMLPLHLLQVVPTLVADGYRGE